MGSKESTLKYREHRKNGYSHTYSYRVSFAKICKEAWKIAKPHYVEAVADFMIFVAHFVVFCYTLIGLSLMLIMSSFIIFYLEGLLKIDPIFIKLIIYVSDVFISAHFIRYLIRTWTHEPNDKD